MAYNKIGFKDRVDSKPESYLVNGTETTITKDDSGLISKGTNLNKATFDHIEDGIYQNSIDIVNVNNTVTNNKEEFDTFKTETTTQLADITNFDRKTYAELKILKDSNKLKEGKRYILTDYRTKYEQPDTKVIKEMDVEELILTANSSNSFEPIVYSYEYPQDTIWFNFNNDKCEDNTTPRNGFITRRYDHVTGNNCPQDWRTMLWARWKPDPQQYYKNDILTNYSVWTSGNAEMGVIYKAGDKLLIARNTKIPKNENDGTVFSVIYDNINIAILRFDKTKINNNGTNKLELKKGELNEYLTFGEKCFINTIPELFGLHNNIFGNNCYNNTFGNNCGSNTFGNDFQNNTLGNNCYNNTLGNNCGSNTFSNHFQNNTLGNDCRNNAFGNYCHNNTFGNDCRNNAFGNYYYNNNIIGSLFTNNIIGPTCYNNIFGTGCYNNIFINFQNNIIGEKCMNIVVKNMTSKNISDLDICDKNYTINIEKNNKEQVIYWYLDDNNQPIYTPIP